MNTVCYSKAILWCSPNIEWYGGIFSCRSSSSFSEFLPVLSHGPSEHWLQMTIWFSFSVKARPFRAASKALILYDFEKGPKNIANSLTSTLQEPLRFCLSCFGFDGLWNRGFSRESRWRGWIYAPHAQCMRVGSSADACWQLYTHISMYCLYIVWLDTYMEKESCFSMCFI